jgi:hypothetical protein
MRERARAIGAELEISPALPRGTAVRLRVPVGLGEPHPMAHAGAHE